MSSILSKLIETQEVSSQEVKDYSGSSFIKESGEYNFTIKKAFVTESKNGAIGIVTEFEGDAILEETFWITNADKETYYERNGKKFPMPSYVDVKKLNYVCTGEMLTELSAIKTEQRLIKHYKYVDDPENEGKKKRVDDNIEADTLVDWIGKEVKLTIQMVQKEGWDKQAKKPNGQGAVTKEGEPITDPVIIGFFNTDGFSAVESYKKAEKAEQLDKDLKRLEKAPIRMFKPKKPKQSGAKSSTGTKSASAPTRPNVF